MSRTINFSTDDGEILIMRDKVNAAKIIGSTIKVWLNNETQYEFNYENREKAKKDFAKLKRYLNEEGRVERIRKGIFIDKACEWLKDNLKCYSTNALGAEYLIEDFKKYMEE